MKTMIDSIYDGDIRPAEDLLSYSDELQKLYARSARMLTEIRNTLPESQRKMIDEFAELKNRISDARQRDGSFVLIVKHKCDVHTKLRADCTNYPSAGYASGQRKYLPFCLVNRYAGKFGSIR